MFDKPNFPRAPRFTRFGLGLGFVSPQYDFLSSPQVGSLGSSNPEQAGKVSSFPASSFWNIPAPVGGQHLHTGASQGPSSLWGDFRAFTGSSDFPPLRKGVSLLPQNFCFF